ncbi:hypothetical protein LY71_12179 [Geodermatophilus tzadiensis]|uniref:Uncharacterized protein n=1 Tax=Geodermatophilus tzadiensis TaxID=1137988 RepID=A0A2T0T180_9ACTN|nr:hypothetical protein [Geodermatophilus tzadiensis]PRY39409.1 hypothetical protein LY71_12179 [Geodermatophilus tzadiensis]
MLWDLLSLTGQLFGLLWLATAVFWGLAGAALAATLGRPAWQGLLLGAAVPVIGPAVLLVVDVVRRGGTAGLHGRLPGPWPARGAREAAVALTVLGAVAVVVVTGLRDTRLAVASGAISLTVRDLGLATVTGVTVVVLLAAAALAWRRPSRIAALAVAWCASWWLLWAAAALLVGDTLRVFADSTGLADALDASVQVGTSWWLVLGLSVVLLAWSTVLLLTGNRSGVPAPLMTGLPQPGVPLPHAAGDPFASPFPRAVGPPASRFPRSSDPFTGAADLFAGPADPFTGPAGTRPGSGGW